MSHKMTWHYYSFDRFKRAWLATLPTLNFVNVRWPSKAGLVSIFLSAYNKEDLIRESVKSVLDQTYWNWELIAIDDGSTDSTGRILDEYSSHDSRIHVAHREKTRMQKAFACGFRLVKGEYITWTNCENRMHPDLLEWMVDSLERYPNWDMIYATPEIKSDDGEPQQESDWHFGYQNPSGSKRIKTPTDLSMLDIWPSNYIGGYFLCRERVAWMLGDNGHLHTMEDNDYLMRVNTFMKLRHLVFPDTRYYCRFHNKSLTVQEQVPCSTPSKDKMIVFDDFRRDFCLSPMLWWVEGVGDIVENLKEWILHAGHIWHQPADFRADLYPSFWMPFIYLQFVDELSSCQAMPAGLPEQAFKVLVLKNDIPQGPLEADISDWNLLIDLGEPVGFPSSAGEAYAGWVSVGDANTLIALLNIRVRSEQFRKIEAEIECPKEPQLRISIVVCTYHGADRLRECVRSIIKQNFPAWHYEVLVINNDPSDRSVDEIVERLNQEYFVDYPDHLRLIHCPFTGLSHARNAGISEARGEIVCFLDDDAQAEPGLLEWIWNAFEENTKAGVIGGSIFVQIPDPRPRWLKPGLEAYWSEFSMEENKYTEVNAWWRYPWGANWCARRKTLFEIGGFRSRYGRRGKGFSGGEEIVAASLAQRLGYSIAIEPRAIVNHVIDTTRFTRRHVWKSIQSGARTRYSMQRDLYIPWDITFLAMVRRIVKRFVDWISGAKNKQFWILLAEWVADFRVLKWYAGDNLRRYRLPIGITDVKRS